MDGTTGQQGEQDHRQQIPEFLAFVLMAGCHLCDRSGYTLPLRFGLGKPKDPGGGMVWGMVVSGNLICYTFLPKQPFHPSMTP